MFLNQTISHSFLIIPPKQENNKSRKGESKTKNQPHYNIFKNKTIMAAIKIIFFIVATTVALTLILTTTTTTTNSSHHDRPAQPSEQASPAVPGKRVSRFLQQKERNPRAADHCHKDHEVCKYMVEGRNTTCCNNKCMDLRYDNKNCGACKNKCDFTETCCEGECVSLSFDKRHCNACNNKCMPGGYCIYGMCDYA